MMRKLVVCGVLGLLGACSSSDETSPEGQQQGINKGEQGWQLAADGGVRYDPNPPSCGSDATPDPLNCEKFLVDKCMTKERIDHLALELCGDDLVGSTTIPADAPECRFGTDQAWLVCCYGGSGATQDAGIEPTPQDAGIEPTPQQDASIYDPQPVDAGFPGQASQCVDVSVGSAECQLQQELASKLASMCEKQGQTLFPFVMDVVKDCPQGYGYHVSGTCCPARQQ